MLKLIFSLSLLSFSFWSYGSGLEISVSGDMVYNQGVNETSQAQDKLTLRGAEVILYAPIDHQFNGVLSIAAHEENGQSNFELHELYLGSSKLIPRTNFKLGQFFLGIGRINRFHQHDWPFTRAPKVHRSFFAKEGIFDSGLEVNYILPSLSGSNLTMGLTSGHKYGHSHTEGAKPKTPTHYARYSHFLEFDSLTGLDIGTSYLGRQDALSNKMSLLGLDLTFKHRVGRHLDKLFQFETWYKNETNSLDELTEQVGFYFFNEYSLSYHYSFGYRLDGFKDLTKRNAITGKKINNVNYGTLAQLTYQSSEFAKMRVSLAHEFDREEGETLGRDTRFQLQYVFFLGSHPAHVF